jgi:hypothetical protein
MARYFIAYAGPFVEEAIPALGQPEIPFNQTAMGTLE